METTWVNIPGGLTDIGAGADGSVWGVNSNDDIYKLNADGSTWTQIEGKLKHIDVGPDGNAWGVNSAGGIYRWDGA